MNDNRGVQFRTIFTDRRDRTHLFHRVNLKISTRNPSPRPTSIHRFRIDVKSRSRARLNNFASVGISAEHRIGGGHPVPVGNASGKSLVRPRGD